MPIGFCKSCWRSCLDGTPCFFRNSYVLTHLEIILPTYRNIKWAEHFVFLTHRSSDRDLYQPLLCKMVIFSLLRFLKTSQLFLQCQKKWANGLRVSDTLSRCQNSPPPESEHFACVFDHGCWPCSIDVSKYICFPISFAHFHGLIFSHVVLHRFLALSILICPSWSIYLELSICLLLYLSRTPHELTWPNIT